MHHYPRNSPEAAARLVSLALIADGHVCRSEMDAVRREDVERTLGLPEGGLPRVMQTLCEDLLCVAPDGLLSCVDGELLDALIRDVDDPALQRRVLAAITSAVGADGHLADAERQVLETLVRAWRVPAAGLAAGEPA